MILKDIHGLLSCNLATRCFPLTQDLFKIVHIFDCVFILNLGNVRLKKSKKCPAGLEIVPHRVRAPCRGD